MSAGLLEEEERGDAFFINHHFESHEHRALKICYICFLGHWWLPGEGRGGRGRGEGAKPAHVMRFFVRARRGDDRVNRRMALLDIERRLASVPARRIQTGHAAGPPTRQPARRVGEWVGE